MPSHWWRLWREGRVSSVARVRKLSRACGSFQTSARLTTTSTTTTTLLSTPSQVLQRPCCPCTTGVLLLPVQKPPGPLCRFWTTGLVGHPIPGQDALSGLCPPIPGAATCSLPSSAPPPLPCTSSLPPHEHSSLSPTQQSAGSLSCITSFSFSCLDPKETDLRGGWRLADAKHLGSLSHFRMNDE